MFYFWGIITYFFTYHSVFRITVVPLHKKCKKLSAVILFIPILCATDVTFFLCLHYKFHNIFDFALNHQLSIKEITRRKTEDCLIRTHIFAISQTLNASYRSEFLMLSPFCLKNFLEHFSWYRCAGSKLYHPFFIRKCLYFTLICEGYFQWI